MAATAAAMEYLLSKLLPLFVYPLGLAILLAMAGTIFAWAKHRLLAIWLGGSAVIVLWASAMPVVSDALLNTLEEDFPPVVVEALPSADAIVVLGGVTPGRVPGKTWPEFSEGVDRLFHALRIYRAGKAPWLVLSGGADEGYPPESELMAAMLMESGLPEQALLLETRSRNTYQNVINVRQVLRARGLNRVLLVTSAFHMRRARAVFERQGMEVIPAAADYQVVEHVTTVLDWLPDASALYQTTQGIKEYLGWWVYRWRGWL